MSITYNSKTADDGGGDGDNDDDTDADDDDDDDGGGGSGDGDDDDKLAINDTTFLFLNSKTNKAMQDIWQ